MRNQKFALAALVCGILDLLVIILFFVLGFKIFVALVVYTIVSLISLFSGVVALKSPQINKKGKMVTFIGLAFTFLPLIISGLILLYFMAHPIMSPWA